MAGQTARAIYDKALKSREELAAEIEVLDAFIALYESLEKKDETGDETDGEQPDLYRPSSSRAAKAAQIAEILNASRRIIIAEGRPMKRGDIVKRLEEKGYQLDGADRNKVFGTNLWRSKRFVSINDKGYWPNDVPSPA